MFPLGISLCFQDGPDVIESLAHNISFLAQKLTHSASYGPVISVWYRCIAAKEALYIKISLTDRPLAPSRVLGNTETCRVMQEHAGPCRGINGYTGNTWELGEYRGIQGNKREYRGIKDNNKGNV